MSKPQYLIRYAVLSVFTLVTQNKLAEEFHSLFLPLPAFTSLPPGVKSDRASSFFLDVPPSETR